MNHPENLPEHDDIIDAIFDRIMRDENKWRIVDAAEANHNREQAEPTFNAQAYAAAMGLNIARSAT